LWLRLRELPSSIEDFFARAIKTNGVVPTIHYREVVSAFDTAVTPVLLVVLNF